MPRHKWTVPELVQQGKWMDAPELVSLITTAKQDVLTLVGLEGITSSTVRLLHDLTLACCLFGYLPPIRLSCLSSLQHPDHSGPCLSPDCRDPKCLGNKLVILSREPLKLLMHLPHHKNQTVWQKDGPIHFQVPAELAELLDLWLTKGHPFLCQQYDMSSAAATMFLTQSGKAYDSNSMQYFWHTWVGKHGGVSKMPPSMCRHIFVDERLSEDRAPGPSDRGAAMAMGNSIGVWNQHYHKQKHFHVKECQRAVNQMPTWKDNLLASSSKASGVCIRIAACHNHRGLLHQAVHTLSLT